jgi:L-2-hydroxyglutarate oxidase LhgO
MKMTSVGAGIGVGVKDYRVVFVFETEPALTVPMLINAFDVPELVMAMLGEIERDESRVLCEVGVAALRRDADAFQVETTRGEQVRCRRVVNAAGLEATALAGRMDGYDPRHVPRIHYAAGHYYALRGRAPFSQLIYPLPETSGLGVHLGFDLAGRSRFGPDVRWIDAPAYRFDDSLRDEFIEGVASWWPDLDPEDLSPDFVGVRPKLSGPGEHSADFMIQDSSVHGVPGLVNLFGIDSPGLTSSLAIGEEVAARLQAGS